jgi:hypothetical protein
MFSALLLAAAPVIIESKSPALDFHYEWSVEAAAVPTLNARFQADALRRQREALKGGEEEIALRRRMGSEPIGHMLAVGWSTAGRSSRLLSLEQAITAYTAGAHSNSGTSSLLWDLARDREIGLDAVLQRPGWWNGAVRQPFCTLLDRERAKRRNEPSRPGEWPNQCPELKELTLTLQDEDGNRRFDHVRITADPYVAGAYAEGEYVISLPLTAAMIARVRPEYRSSFEPRLPIR